ncbi:MAG: hypothetical protein RR573_03725 [Oscillospiraceae bacterium]
MKLKKEIYESYNGKNVIYEADEAYVLMTADKLAWFDKDTKILDTIIDCIEMYGNFTYNIANKNFMCNHDSQTIYLKNIIFSIGRNLIMQNIKGYICSVDGDPSNCYLYNLKLDQTLVAATYGNDNKKYIFLMNEAKNAIAYTNYDEGLLNILNKFSFAYDEKKHNFYCCKNAKCSLQYFVWVYFRLPDVTADNILDKIIELKKYFHTHSDSITIDHKLSDHDKTDNRIENLQLLPNSLNSKKYTHTQHLQPNCKYFAYDGSEGWFKRKITEPFGLLDYEIYGLKDANKGKEDIADLVKFCKTGEMPEGKIGLSIGTMINTLYFIDKASEMANRAKNLAEEYLNKYARNTK